jgi:hypothetical protein
LDTRTRLIGATKLRHAGREWFQELQSRLKGIAASEEALDLATVRDLTLRLLLYRMSEEAEDEMAPLRYCQELAKIAGWYATKDARREPVESMSPDQQADWERKVQEFRAKAS